MTNFADTAVLDDYEGNGEWHLVGVPCERHEVSTNGSNILVHMVKIYGLVLKLNLFTDYQIYLLIQHKIRHKLYLTSVYI